MGSFSNYAELKILEHITGKTSFTKPTVYVGLSTANPDEDASGLAEPSGNGYARVDSTGVWGTAADGEITNDSVITFPEASGSWGTISHFALFDAESGGNMLAYGALSESKAVGSGDTARFSASALTITLD
jgi:hypothetical protein